jgi:hypothetical protein
VVRFCVTISHCLRNILSTRTLDEAAVAKRIQAYDPRYLTTYYAIDTVNFTPADLSSALDTLDAPYLPLLLLEAAGVPLDSSFRGAEKDPATAAAACSMGARKEPRRDASTGS